MSSVLAERLFGFPFVLSTSDVEVVAEITAAFGNESFRRLEKRSRQGSIGRLEPAQDWMEITVAEA